MLVRPRRSAPAALATAAALVAGGLGAGTLTASPASAHDGQQTRAVSLFPSDDLTVRDARQITGRRVALPTDGCTAPVECGLIARVNQLDGFDLDPRLALRFSGPVDPVAVAAATTLTAQGDRDRGDDEAGAPGRGRGPGPRRPRRSGPPDRRRPGRLRRGHLHRLRPPGAPAGPEHALRAAGRADRPRHAAAQTFTTLSATDGLLDLRRQLDRGAYDAAGIPEAARGLRVDGRFPLTGTTITQLQDRGPAGAHATAAAAPAARRGGRQGAGPPTSSAPTSRRRGSTARIPQTPTRDAGPRRSASRLPFVLVLPAAPTPAGGWPAAVFGHGFTRSKADVFLAAAARTPPAPATIATDVVGHGYGPRQHVARHQRRCDDRAARVRPGRRPRRRRHHRQHRGHQHAGRQPRPRRSPAGRPAADRGWTSWHWSARSPRRGRRRRRRHRPRRDGTGYYGQSFGGIYGTMVAGADPRLDARR